MTNDIESPESRPLASRRLPWLLAMGALMIYVLTLNHWASVLNVSQVARVSGWTWHPELSNPIYYLITLPLGLLPAASVPVALNILSAVCAALVLCQLARCVALLPHDRTHDQREREISDGAVFTGKFSWVPPVLAVCLCGLQLSFWEHATNGTSEMLDLLLIAFVVRSLLEYRYHGRERWLTRAAFVMGAGMASNAVMIAYFPLFLAALIWIRGISFFNIKFLVRTLLFGLAGLSLYLLLPIITSLKTPELASFWAGLTTNVYWQVDFLQKFSRKALVLFSLTSLVPIFLISIRWASYFGDTSQTGQLFATISFHVVHAFFLGAIFWVALDPPFSPRNAGYPYVCLPFYFFGALSAGYFSGYFLLVFGPLIERRMRRAPTPIIDTLHKVSTVAVLAMLVITPVALVWRNQAEIRLTNGSMLKDYAANLVAGLPAKAVLVSDEPARQFFVQAWITSAGRSKDYVVLNSSWLKWDTYHRRLREQYGNLWPLPDKIEGRQSFTPPMLIALLTDVSKSNQVYYLHPSFGYYFEVFHAEPSSLVYALKSYPTGQLLPPSLTTEALAQNESFFTKLADSSLKPILAVTHRPTEANQYVGEGPLRKIRLRQHSNMTALLLGMHYSRAYNSWGVEAQKAGQLDSAARWFELATQLNPGNVVAERNLEFNRKLKAGQIPPVEMPRAVEDLFGTGRSWDQVLSANGPFDEPGLCLMQGFLYVQSGLYRQAAQYFDRVRAISETELTSRIWLAQLQLMANQPDAALALTDEIHAHTNRFELNTTNQIELLTVEAAAHFARNDSTQAVQLIEKALAADPRDEQVLNTALKLYNQYGQISNSLEIVERQLAVASNNVAALLNKSSLCIQLGNHDLAITTLNRLLATETNNAAALLNRAIAYLGANRLNEAKADYEYLVQQHPTAYQLYYGLSDVALRQGDTNAAIRYTETYLTNAPPDIPEYQAMGARLRLMLGEKQK